MDYKKVLNNDIKFTLYTKVTPTKGHLVYEYNPLRNYRLSKPMLEYKGQFYTKDELGSKFNITWDESTKEWSDQVILRERGELVDFITDELKVSLSHPINIVPQYSYDGSVNLILNDGLNTPKLINTRFSATGRNTYEVVDRKGNNDTNIYDQGSQFEIDTSLYKQCIKIPKIDFKGVNAGGNLKIGNYHFYFRLSDADGNETDFVGESGLVSVFIGQHNPSSIHTGTKNENSFKQVSFIISNVDSAYSYLHVYYSRYTAELGENYITEYARIEKKYIVNNGGVCKCLITGFEETTPVDASDINLSYQIVDAAKAQAVCQNMLFLGNIHKPNIPYKELADLSLRFLPTLHEETYPLIMDQNYVVSSNAIGYYDPKFIYDKTGYWNKELYRFGIVYILPDNTLTPVFNIRGGLNLTTESVYIDYPVRDNEKRVYIQYNESNNYILARTYKDKSGNIISSTGNVSNENIKGVISLNPTQDTNKVYGIKITADGTVIDELKQYVKGYFFVRQPRIPTILAQGITIGIDKTSHLPCIPTQDGILATLKSSLDKTHVQTEDITGVNYVSEGFLTRYQFKFKKKSSGLWGKIGSVVTTVVGVAAAAVATVATCGAAGIAIGISAGTAAIAGGIAVAGAAVITAGAAAIQEGRYWIQRETHSMTPLNGRETRTPSGYKKVETDSSRQLEHSFKDRIIIKDSTNVRVQGLLCPDYEVNQAYYNQIFTGNKHLLESTVSQASKPYFTNNNTNYFYVENYTDSNLGVSQEFNIIGVPDGVKLVSLGDKKFRSRAGSAEEAWRYECIGTDYRTLKKDKDLIQKFKEKVKEDPSLSSDMSDYTDTELSELLDMEATNKNMKINSDIVRGNFGAYLAFDDTEDKFMPAETVNIYVPGYNKQLINEYVDMRMRDNTSYQSVSDRFDIGDCVEPLTNSVSNFTTTLYRGDCYICQFTHRFNRNFNDPAAPYNDDIVDADSWRDNYDPNNVVKYNSINLGDVNAVRLGMWVTFRVRSNNNLNIRTLDGSEVDSCTMMGHDKGFYPYHDMSTEGTFKCADSQIYNKGFSKSLSERWNFEVPDVPHIKNWFGTRIMYSDIHINDAFKNGFRIFQGTNYRDYTREYGEIVKLVPFESSLLCVFEHGIALIPVNERAVAGQGAGGNVYINTSNVLPENPKIISDMFGSQWPESILKVPGKTGDTAQYVYGVDTVAKKIWRTDGNSLQCISDFKVQEFLNNNITLGERELTPIIGVRNVKTVYNAFKRDVMFTFYDNTYGFEEKVWNLCWNEILEKFITFYSWVPSHMENINNIPFSFDRNTTKWIAKLGVSHTDNSFADGITISNNIIKNETIDLGESLKDQLPQVKIKYLINSGEFTEQIVYCNQTIESDSEKNAIFIGTLSLSNRVLPNNGIQYSINYNIERDNYKNHELFKIHPVAIYTINSSSTNSNLEYNIIDSNCKFPDQTVTVYGLFYYGNYTDLLSHIYYKNKEGNAYPDDSSNREIPNKSDIGYTIYCDLTGKRPTLERNDQINPDKIVRLLNIKASISIVDNDKISLSDDYYNLKAGYTAGTSLIDAGYYESVVAVIPEDNMQLLTTDFWKHGQAGIIDITDDIKPTYWYGKQHPFEFECVVVNDPSVHKIFDTLEIVANKAVPESFHYEVIGDCYDFVNDKPNMYYRQEAIKHLWQHNGFDILYDRNYENIQTSYQKKSADLIHTYYSRQDTINEIEDYYVLKKNSSIHDYRHLSGAELIYYPNRNEYRVWQHTPAIDIDSLSSDSPNSVTRANCRYIEDKWKVTINPIIVCYKNEYSSESDFNPKLSLPIYNSPIPNEIKTKDELGLPNNLRQNKIDESNWLNDVSIYGTNFGEAQNRKELDVRGKFIKIRIRYSGKELAIINFLNTIYRVSYS